MKTSPVISQGWSVRRSGEKFLWLRLAKESLEFAAACHGLGAVTAVLARGRVVHSEREEMVGS